MYSSLFKVDFAAVDPTGRTVHVQTDHRQAIEIEEEPEISILFALVRVLNGFRMGQCQAVQYAAFDTPPIWLQEAIASAGGELRVMEQPVELVGTQIDPYDLADQTFARLSAVVLRREGLTLGIEALRVLEENLGGREYDEEEEIEQWTAIVELAAVSGEVARQMYGGRWVRDEHDMATIPFAFSASDRFLNLAGKAERFIENGFRDRVSDLVTSAIDELPESPDDEVIMISLKPHDFHAKREAFCQPLSPMQDDSPLITYGIDMPNTFGTFLRSEHPERSVEELHEAALQTLATIEVQVDDLAIQGLKFSVVSNSYYAAEKILDVTFMQRMHQRYDTELLAVGIPIKGRMFVTNGVQEPAQISKLMAVVEGEYRRGEALPISPTLFLVQGGRVSGVIRLSDEIPETVPEPKRGLFSRWFSKS